MGRPAPRPPVSALQPASARPTSLPIKCPVKHRNDRASQADQLNLDSGAGSQPSGVVAAVSEPAAPACSSPSVLQHAAVVTAVAHVDDAAVAAPGQPQSAESVPLAEQAADARVSAVPELPLDYVRLALPATEDLQHEPSGHERHGGHPGHDHEPEPPLPPLLACGALTDHRVDQRRCLHHFRSGRRQWSTWDQLVSKLAVAEHENAIDELIQITHKLKTRND